MYMKDTLTYLERDLNPGDTQVYLNNISNFNVNSSTPYYQKGFIIWNYTNSKGYKYPELTYSRNIYPDDLYNNSLFEESGIDKENNIITLKEPWKYGTIKKEEKLSQTNAGNTFNYGALNADRRLSAEWQTFHNYIQNENKTGEYQDTTFRPGTKYIKIVFLVNYNGLQNVTTNFKNIVFTEI